MTAADYRRFLAAVSVADLPYFGGPFVESAQRRLRLVGPVDLAPGFWRFEIRGRWAHPVAPADPPDLSGLPAVRGYAVAGYLVHTVAERLALPPADEPVQFAPVVGRRWPTGELLADTVDFETGIEDIVRAAYADRRPLAGTSGVPAALRAAYGYAVLLRMAGEMGVPGRPAEARPHLAALANEGDSAARRLLHEFARARAAAASAPATPPVSARRDESGAGERPDSGRANAELRAADALYAARAALRGTRWLAGEILEVRYLLDGEQFVSLVDGGTLRVVDAGICLDGHDNRLTLDSLPGVIREAMDTGVLHITAW